MINKENFKALLRHLKFKEKDEVFTKNFKKSGAYLIADFKKQELDYPEIAGLIVNNRQTCNFSSAENIVVFECVYQLLNKGYKPIHLELEPKWKLGHGASGGRADILVRNQKDKPLLIIECKTYGKEFDKAWKDTQEDGGQLFSYAQQISGTDFLCLYASEFDENNCNIHTQQRIISHKDNEKILEHSEELTSYKKANNVKERFGVWKETYKKEYTETGIFESNIQPYQIGKSNYTLETDTRPVTDKDKEGKYHRFRTILRQHNIARKETAFEVMVNLFLAKIVDEEENKTNLEFYWKGIAYDNYFDFIDRLQKLYQIGMRKFLKDEVMYISNDQIDNAFWTVKNKRNATKKQIQKYFRDLKFFSNNAFSLINVHNERLFNRNTKVLVELVQMWQGLRLKTREQNQFLGDMFEFFLDNSIKQSEGQFFTPIPITKFIVASLPLEYKIQNSSEPLKAIDYACGSGHFLTEYAHQIKPLVEKYKETEVSKYYENIVGIEKEDRLAKIAKVSAYMYGQDQIKIIEEDALSDIEDVKPESFDVLVANPPFAVEGFLLNLTDKQKHGYKLIETTELNSNTSNIQCFFIERAKHFMSPGGTVGIIVPSSVLSNSDATHIGTREIILKYFDIISLVELGSGTFGKTGTNTVVLFLKRKAHKPEAAEHYQNRVEDYFETNLSEQLKGNEKLDSNINEYQDLGLIKAYCKHNELDFEQYINLFGITTETIANIEELLKTEIFTTYRKDFENSSNIKNLKKKKLFKDKNQEEKEIELNKRLIKYLYDIEKNKLFYFMLAFENKQKVLIVKSPSNKKVQKQFLGYEWSGAKGNEGIKYNGGNTVHDIITPMFNPKNLSDRSKINYLIRQNFLGKQPSDLKEIEQFSDLITYANVTDILDFSRKDFNKAFSLNPKKNITIETKWELVKIKEVCELGRGRVISLDFIEKNKGEYPVYSSQTQDNGVMGRINTFDFDGEYVTWTTDGIYAGTCSYRSGKFNCTNVCGTLKQKSEDINIKYLPLVLNTLTDDYVVKSANPKLMNNVMAEIKIPLPPKEIQEQIVTECEAIDTASEKAQATIYKAKAEIEQEVKEVIESGYEKKKLEDVAEIKKGKSITQKNTKKGNVKVVAGGINFAYLHNESNRPKNTITISASGANAGFVNIWKEEIFASDCTTVFGKSDLNNFYAFNILKHIQDDIFALARGSAQPHVYPDDIKRLTIPVPPISDQEQLVSKVEKLEKQISEARIIIESAAEKKQQIMDKYLK